MNMNHGLLVGSVLVAVGASGCLMSGNYHTAKTLEKGTSQVGMTFSTMRYEKENSDGSRDAVALPNIIPEITYHIGVADDVEVGGRAALGSLGIEGDVKYRFLRSDKVHLAVAPALSYQAAFVFQAVGVRLPVIATYQLSDMIDFNAAAFLAQTNFGNADSDFSTFNGNLTSTGGALGFDIHGETLSIRPAFEFTKYVANVNGDTFDGFNTVNFLVHIAWTGGREKQQLDRIERKLDAMAAPPAPVYAPAPMAPAPVYAPSAPPPPVPAAPPQ